VVPRKVESADIYIYIAYHPLVIVFNQELASVLGHFLAAVIALLVIVCLTAEMEATLLLITSAACLVVCHS